MSTTTAPMSLPGAIVIADELVGLLEPSCEQIMVCGSIRRQEVTVGDIDIVAVARRAPVADLFGEALGSVDLLALRLDELWRDRVIEQRINKAGNASWGTQSKRGIYRGLNVDINAVDAEVLGMWLIIKTGPADYSHAFVTHAGQQAALRTRDGQVRGYRPGLLPAGFTVENGFRLFRAHLFVPTPTEQSVYAALGRPYLAPEDRS